MFRKSPPLLSFITQEIWEQWGPPQRSKCQFLFPCPQVPSPSTDARNFCCSNGNMCCTDLTLPNPRRAGPVTTFWSKGWTQLSWCILKPLCLTLASPHSYMRHLIKTTWMLPPRPKDRLWGRAQGKRFLQTGHVSLIRSSGWEPLCQALSFQLHCAYKSFGNLSPTIRNVILQVLKGPMNGPLSMLMLFPRAY